MKVSILLLAALPVLAQQHWVATWGTAQQQYRAAGRGGPAPTPPAARAPQPAPPPGAPDRRYPVPPPLGGVNNQTVRMVVRTSIGGHSLRVRLANAPGASALSLGAAHIAIRSHDSAIVPASDRALTFSGQPTATIFA